MGNSSALPVSNGSQRFRFIDALRGLAALSVALFHLVSPEVTPAFLQPIVAEGGVGVDVFFVISGFVIAYSLRTRRISLRFFGNFALRRSIRLDPPYWVAIAVVIAVNAALAVAYRHFGAERWIVEAPSPGRLASHFFYLQGILGYRQILGVFWTLCVEVQFYITFCVLQACAQRLVANPRQWTPADPRAVIVVFFPAALVSLATWATDVDRNFVWITNWFCMFYLGSAACWALYSSSRLHKWAFAIFCGAVVAVLLHRVNHQLVVALVTAIAIFAVGVAGHLSDWLSGRVLQYLGRISYSLYLLHAPIGAPVMSVGYHLTKIGALPVLTPVWLSAALFASIAAAHLLHKYVEAPSVNFAKRFKPAAGQVPEPQPQC